MGPFFFMYLFASKYIKDQAGTKYLIPHYLSLMVIVIILANIHKGPQSSGPIFNKINSYPHGLI